MARESRASRTARMWIVVAAAALVGASAVGASSCLVLRDETGPQAHLCTSCHGQADRPGDEVLRSAPPVDLLGSTDPASPGVGAHQAHLTDNGRHALIACDECHTVPQSVDAPGHADTTGPAEVLFGARARLDGHVPVFDGAAHSCADAYCHFGTTFTWNAPPTPLCGSCHSIPPASPHPQAPDCSICHAEVIDSSQNFVAPYLHVDGTVQVDATCNGCHGSAQNNAPPQDLNGSSDPTSLGVGAHQAHLAGGSFSRPVPCEECHVVPASVGDAGHIDTLPADLTFSGVAVTNGLTPSWDHAAATCSNGYCHGPQGVPNPITQWPEWNVPGSAGCGTCHGLPPNLPHPQVGLDKCHLCHEDVDASLNITDPSQHVNGMTNLEPMALVQCNSCHGTDLNGSPPPDLDGNMTSSSPGVGVHQIHLAPVNLFRPVACQDCHVVPASIDDAGHYDTLSPAELTFSGPAVSFGLTPSYDPVAHTCSDVWCHAPTAVIPPSGSVPAPQWTTPFAIGCTSCHAFPPPPPHDTSASCWNAGCHTNMQPSFNFTNPLLHVNGIINFP